MSHCFLDFAKFLVKIFVFSKLALGGGKWNVSNVFFIFFSLKKEKSSISRTSSWLWSICTWYCNFVVTWTHARLLIGQPMTMVRVGFPGTESKRNEKLSYWISQLAPISPKFCPLRSIGPWWPESRLGLIKEITYSTGYA